MTVSDCLHSLDSTARCTHFTSPFFNRSMSRWMPSARRSSQQRETLGEGMIVVHGSPSLSMPEVVNSIFRGRKKDYWCKSVSSGGWREEFRRRLL